MKYKEVSCETVLALVVDTGYTAETGRSVVVVVYIMVLCEYKSHWFVAAYVYHDFDT